MEILSLTKKRYAEWDRFCLKSNDAWFWHTTDWLKYSLLRKPERKSRSLSFCFTENKKILVICPLILEFNPEDKILEFTFGSEPTISPAFHNQLKKHTKEKIEKRVFAKIDKLAQQFKVSRAIFQCLPQPYQKIPKGNPLLQYGFLNISLNAQIIDLSKTETQLWQELSTNHKRNIKKAKNLLKTKIYYKNNITKTVFENYRKMHHEATGRVSRPLITFKYMFSWIKNNKAILVGALKDNDFVGFILISCFKNLSYYHSGCNKPAIKNIGIGHLLHWQTILWLKNHEFNFYEIGLQKYGNTLSQIPLKKETNISHFKKHFGGQIFPKFIGEKYYDRDYFLRVYNKRVKNYAQSLKLP